MMKLKNILAEFYYLKDTDGRPLIPFGKQDSNVKDFYCRVASEKIPQLLSGYISNSGWFAKLIKGCIRDFINVHGIVLDKENYSSLAKRIISRIRAEVKQGHE